MPNEMENSVYYKINFLVCDASPNGWVYWVEQQQPAEVTDSGYSFRIFDRRTQHTLKITLVTPDRVYM